MRWVPALLAAAALAQAPRTAGDAAPPTRVESEAILQDVGNKALDYSRNLPNYICLQVTRRHVDPGGGGKYRLLDTIVERLSFFEQKEAYQVLEINGHAVKNVAHDAVGGSRSSGEFGSMLQGIFDPASEAAFRWEAWTTMHDRPAMVFSFRVRKPRYDLHVTARGQGYAARIRNTKLSVGFHGLLFVDRADHGIRRLEMECDDIPADFPLREVSMVLDYGIVAIAGQDHLLPVTSDVRSRSGKYAAWNEVTYQDYNRFGADTNITFETPAPRQ